MTCHFLDSTIGFSIGTPMGYPLKVGRVLGENGDWPQLNTLPSRFHRMLSRTLDTVLCTLAA